MNWIRVVLIIGLVVLMFILLPIAHDTPIVGLLVLGGIIVSAFALMKAR